MTHPLDSFFAPSSIAVIGASRDTTKIPGTLLSFLRKNGFPGALYPINAKYDDIDGLRCWPSVASVGKAIDLAVLVIPANVVLAALQDCADAGVKNAIIISSGFAEEGGEKAEIQRQITLLAKRSGMRICGPNAQGYLNDPLKIAATFSPTVDVRPGVARLTATRKRVGVAAQSGGIGFAIGHRAQALGLPMSIVISTGNESDLGVGEVLDYMVQDANTDVILLFIEGIRDPEHFDRAARRAAEIGKPIVAIKVGRSHSGAKASALHTASVAGSPAAYDALFARYGFIVTDDIDEAVTIAAILTTAPAPRGDRVAVVTTSGGGGIWAADALSSGGLRLPDMSEPMQSAIRALIPSYGAARNPIDITAQAVHSGGLQKTLDMLCASDEVDSIVVVISLSSETRIPFKPPELTPLLAAQTKPVLFWTYTLPSSFARSGFADCGAVVLSNLTQLATALRKVTSRSLAAGAGDWLRLDR
jgi:acyl-CoA synthetase (NDP forming)